MKEQKIACILCLFMCIIFLSMYLLHSDNYLDKKSKIIKINLSQKTYYKFDQHMSLYLESSNIPLIFKNVFENVGIKKSTSYENANIIFTEKLDDIENFKNIGFSKNIEWIYGLRSINILAGKSMLPLMIIVNNPNSYHKMIPKTWILGDRKDEMDLDKQFDKNGFPKFGMILKKNLQRQKGIEFVTHKNDLQLDSSNVVVQKLLTNPMLVKGLKINFRIYVVIICRKNKQLDAYMFDDGFLYYTTSKYDKNVMTHESQITTGLERSAYQDNPLTLKDLYKTLTNKQSKMLQLNIEKLLQKTLKSYAELLKINEFDGGPGHFVILGCDLAPDEDLNVLIMEINKGPDLQPKDRRDGILKFNMIKQTICKLYDQNFKNNFIKIY